MKIEDLAFLVAGETLALLEKKYHYHIPEEHKREIEAAIRDNLNDIIEKTRKN